MLFSIGLRQRLRYRQVPVTSIVDDPKNRLKRRDFFRNTASRVLDPLTKYLADRVDPPPKREVLRPPGAIAEALFSETCRRCGQCVEVCPADAIFPLVDHFGERSGTPAIDPSLAACVVCEGLQCTHVCPSGALLPVLEPHLIRMGKAEVYETLCVRSEGQDCTLCVDRCPIGEVAIRFPGEGPPEVLRDGCVGCGVCEFYCPTTPKAIVVHPS